MHIAPGTVLADKYRVDRLLGEGGMGVVVAATHLQLHQQIAVKLLRPEAMANPALIERFKREARAAARVHGEHVARVIDVGDLPGGLPYIVMEYLEGEDLERTLSRRGPLPIEETVDYLLQTCEAVGEAHAANIVHRDLKPANLFLAMRPNEDQPILKVLDFGISKILEPETDAITRTSALMGTAYYMSPEQLTSAKKVDTRTDIWALGVIIYELLTGKRPYEAGTMPEVVAQILENTPTPLKELRPDAPDQLCHVVSMCLRRMDERIPTVADLATALAPFAPAHALPLVARVNKLVAASGRLRAQSVPVPAASAAGDHEARHQIAVDTIVDSQGATSAVTLPDDGPLKSEPAPPLAAPVSTTSKGSTDSVAVSVQPRSLAKTATLGGAVMLALVGLSYVGVLALKPVIAEPAHGMTGSIPLNGTAPSVASAATTPIAPPSTSVTAVPAEPSMRVVTGVPSVLPSARPRTPPTGAGSQMGTTTAAPPPVPSSSAAGNPLIMKPF